jgi:hypothetical protein
MLQSNPKNANSNCSRSVYGSPSGQRGCGGSGFGGLAVSRSIGQPLADNPAKGALRPLYVIDAELNPIAVAEIEFGEVAVQMGLADVKIAAVDPALQGREETLDGIGVRFGAVAQFARPFLSSVIDHDRRIAGRCADRREARLSSVGSWYRRSRKRRCAELWQSRHRLS